MRKQAILTLLSALLVVGQVRGDDSRARAEEKLRRTILDKYDSYSIPNDLTDTSFRGFEVRSLEMDEERHVARVQGWLQESWNDPRLVWNPEENDGITMLGMDPKSVWKPDFAIYDSAETGKIIACQDTVQAIAYSSGKVLFVPPCDIEFDCVMDLTYWPHDTHNCTIKLGSWIRSGLVLNLNITAFKLKIHMTTITRPDGTNVTLSEWDITDTNVFVESKYYDCCSEPYLSLKMSLLVSRNAPAYCWTVKIPVVCLCLMTMILFLLPPGAGEKIVFGGVCLILDFLYISYASTVIRYVPSHTPLIVQLIAQQIVLVLISVFVSAIVLRMARGPNRCGLPSILRSPVTALARFLCLGNYTIVNDDSQISSKADEAERGSDDSLKNSAVGSDWLTLAAVVDRVALIAYLAICTIILVRFCSIL